MIHPLARNVADADTIIQRYQLQPHPEGGFYAETYRSAEEISKGALPGAFSGNRNFSTAILYLLKNGDFSAWHRILQDEVWHFYLGGSLQLVMISPDGVFSEILLGHNVSEGEYVQYVVPAGYWFGAKPSSDAEFSFVGCTVSPGFDFSDFELGNRTTLLMLFPHLEKEIQAFIR